MRINRKILITSAAVAVVGAGIAWAVINNGTNSSGPVVTTNTVNQTSTPTSGQDKSTPSGNNDPGQPTNSQTGSDSGSTGHKPSPPHGEFVSSHNIPSPSVLESSTCTTSVGSTCQISFTNLSTGATKSLPAKSVDENGAAIWKYWKPSQIGLTAGTWTITATATNGSFSTSVTDPKKLVISP